MNNTVTSSVNTVLEVENPKAEIENSKVPVVVDFFASWCGPCKMMSPVIEKAYKKYGSDLKVIKVDIEKHADFANEHQIKCVPTILFFKEGKVVKREMGCISENQLCDIIDTQLLQKSENLEVENPRLEIESSKGALMVDFFATWCGPCKMMNPVVEKIHQKYGSDLKVIKVDIDKHSDLAEEFNIQSVPTTLFFKDGKVVARQVGLVSEAKLGGIIDINLMLKEREKTEKESLKDV